MVAFCMQSRCPYLDQGFCRAQIHGLQTAPPVAELALCIQASGQHAQDGQLQDACLAGARGGSHDLYTGIRRHCHDALDAVQDDTVRLAGAACSSPCCSRTRMLQGKLQTVPN